MKQINRLIFFGLILLSALISCEEEDIGSIVEIYSISPISAQLGDTLTITGSGFKNEMTTIVKFTGDVVATVTEASSTELKVIVPDGAESGTISVRIGVNSIAVYDEEFTYIESPPLISSIYPTQGPVNTPIKITGSLLSEASDVVSDTEYLSATTVLFGEVEAELDSVSSEYIWLKVPEGVEEGDIEVTIKTDTLISDPYIFPIGDLRLDDDFERSTTDWAEVGASNPISQYFDILKGKWMIEDPDSDGAENNYLESTSSGSNNFTMVSNLGSCLSGEGNSFNVSMDVQVIGTANSSWSGIAFNVQDESNYYVLRLGGGGGIQLLRMASPGGTKVVFSNNSYASSLPGNTFYRMEVSSDTEYVFNVVIKSLEGDVIFETEATDATSSFNTGRCGFYSNTGGIYDNFTLITSSL